MIYIKIIGMSYLLAVLGRDVSSSLSPMLHTAAAEACQLNVKYTAINCPKASDFFERTQLTSSL